MFDVILGFIASTAIEVISFLGYFGVFLLMTLESTFLPIPSELIMPFAGYLAYKGETNFGESFGSLLNQDLISPLISIAIRQYMAQYLCKESVQMLP